MGWALIAILPSAYHKTLATAINLFLRFFINAALRKRKQENRPRASFAFFYQFRLAKRKQENRPRASKEAGESERKTFPTW
jgi:hypothetical protein